MALVNLLNMVVLDNPTHFGNPFQFEITFECLQNLDDDLEWKVVYVASAEDSNLDQTLEEVLVGPVPVGVNKFVLQADAPDYKSIPDNDILGVTVILITCSYKEQEFARVGYYVNNEYSDEFDPEVGPPKPLDMSKVYRQILADKPRVTRFPIDWGGKGGNNADNEDIPTSPMVDANVEMDDEMDNEVEEEDELEDEADEADEEASNGAIIEDLDVEMSHTKVSSAKIFGGSRENGSIVSHSDLDMEVA